MRMAVQGQGPGRHMHFTPPPTDTHAPTCLGARPLCGPTPHACQQNVLCTQGAGPQSRALATGPRCHLPAAPCRSPPRALQKALAPVASHR